MPTHGFTAPWHMIRFVSRLPRGRKTHAFCLATRAGLKVGGVFTPGISGTGTFVIALLLALKGYRVRGVMSLDMPSNWTAFHTGLHPETVRAIIDRAKPRAERFFSRLCAGKTVALTRNNLYEIIWGSLLIPITLPYLLIGRFFLSKLFFANNRCNGCGVCADNCLVGAIKMAGRGIPHRPYWKYNCENCMRCMSFCPQSAIEAGHSWAVILYIITSIPVSVFLVSWAGDVFSIDGGIHSGLLNRLIDLLYLYLSMFLSYAVFERLVRIPLVNTLFTYTTLTHIYRRYSEPETTLRDISPETSTDPIRDTDTPS
jgi:Pyruvate/2-oxoacid:ferredoxin oxidoreductase delta subunit